MVILSIETLPVPHVASADRLEIDELGYGDDGIAHVGTRFGYMDEPNVPKILRQAMTAGLECPPEVDAAAAYFGLQRERTVIMGSQIEV